MSTEPFVLRAGTPDDVPFVADSWLKSETSRESPCPRGLHMNKALFLREEKLRIRATLARLGVELRVACVPDTPDAILGWALLEDGVVHYVYTKRDARRLGIARALLSDLHDVEYASLPATAMPQAIPADWTYNPYRAFPR